MQNIIYNKIDPDKESRQSSGFCNADYFLKIVRDHYRSGRDIAKDDLIRMLVDLLNGNKVEVGAYDFKLIFSN